MVKSRLSGKNDLLKRFLIVFGVFLDMGAIFLSLVAASWLKFFAGLFPQSQAVIGSNLILIGATSSVPVWLIIFSVSGTYRLHWDRSWTDEVAMIFKPVTLGMILLLILAFMLNARITTGRWILVIYYVLMLIFLFLSRTISRLTERKLSKSGRLKRIAAIVGIGKAAVDLRDYLDDNRSLGYKLAGFVRPPHPDILCVNEDEIIGEVSDLGKIMKHYRISELLVTIASNFHEDVLALLLPATNANVRVKVVPDLFDVVAGHVHSTQIMGHPLMELTPEKLKPWQKLIKTATDYIMSLFILFLGLPFWLITCIAIKINSKGPVFYRQRRVGIGGRIFRVFKFRSMVMDAEKYSGPVWADKNDPRITWMGKLLRKTRIDEVPQFINVICGDMSIVGPRPERPNFVEELKSIYPFYPKRLTVKPGITGWAQVKLGYDTSVEDVAEKLKYDFYYLENQSLFLDLEILARTIVVILTGKGAH